MTTSESATPPPSSRKVLGAWYTPPELVDLVVERTISHDVVASAGRSPVRVLDPACGDGRFLAAAARRVRRLGGRAAVTGVDVDPSALAQVDEPRAELVHADALALDWGGRSFDVVVGNPPFLSQLSRATTRSGASRHGGGPYADAAAEFLALAVRLSRPGGGRVGLVLPQSILASRDAGPVRQLVDGLAERTWSWWEPRRLFDAEVVVCALGFRRRALDDAVVGRAGTSTWASVVAEALGVPVVGQLRTDGTLGDRALARANFRDEYYGLVPAVVDDADGSAPPLVTSGAIDPARCRWGERPVRFAKQTFAAPRVHLDRLDPAMRRWATQALVPKVLVANQTRVIEAVADPGGAWLPGVPVTWVVPAEPDDVWAVAAVLTSPVAAALAWHRGAGTGLSARTVRIGPSSLTELPWPAGDLAPAIASLRRGDVAACGRLATAAYGCRDASALVAWWDAGVATATGAAALQPDGVSVATGAPDPL